MADTYSPDVAQQIPAGGNPNRPQSGTYGEGAALERLDAALPGMEPEQQQEIAPTPMGGGPAPQQTPPGLPPGLLAPSRQPNVPVSTPMSQPDLLVGSGPEKRIALLEALVQSTEVSQETKEFAQITLNWIRRAGG